MKLWIVGNGGMKIVVAMDSFKGTLKAVEACEIVADALSESAADAEIVVKPMADGGEGTAQAMIEAANGKWIARTVMGPLPDMEVEAGFAWFEHDRTAVVEMACASGIELLSSQQMNPLLTTTYGTGQLIKAAIEYGAEKIMLAVGGSATVDGGFGAAMALGWKFLDGYGHEIPMGGIGLGAIERIERGEMESPVVVVLCDVENPLCGPNGAAAVYGPQKGATPEMVEQLEAGLKNLAELVDRQLQCDINVPGAGAAGGLAGGAIAFMNARLVSGIETVMAYSNLAEEIESADWVITGEGSFDEQSLSGKVVSGILKAASGSGARMAVIAGRVGLSQKQWERAGISITIAATPSGMALQEALQNSKELLGLAGRRFAREYLSS